MKNATNANLAENIENAKFRINFNNNLVAVSGKWWNTLTKCVQGFFSWNKVIHVNVYNSSVIFFIDIGWNHWNPASISAIFRTLPLSLWPLLLLEHAQSSLSSLSFFLVMFLIFFYSSYIPNVSSAHLVGPGNFIHCSKLIKCREVEPRKNNMLSIWTSLKLMEILW